MEAEIRKVFSIGGSKALTIPATDIKAGDEVKVISNSFLFVDIHGELTKEEMEDLYFKDLHPLIMEKIMKKHRKEQKG